MTKLDDHYYGVVEADTGLEFKEYVLEPYKPDGRGATGTDAIPGRYNTMMFITSDRALNDFQEIIYKTCAKRENKFIPKNDLYAFASDDGAHRWPIVFTESITKECSEFSGVEYIITHYDPKLETGRRDNIIMDTFLKSCHIIFEHLSTFTEKIPGKLVMNEGTKQGKKLGRVNPRMLFKKHDSNLFYLDTSDNTDKKANETEPFTMRKAAFMPQMTFRAKIEHIIPILKQMVLHDTYRTTAFVKELKNEYDVIITVESCVDDLLRILVVNGAKSGSDVGGRDFQIIRTLLFLIMYKIYMFLESYKKSNAKEKENYFKNHLGFASRHRNHDYYVLLKKYLQKWAHVSENEATNLVLEIVNQPEILRTYMLKEDPDVFTREAPKRNSRKYGDPSYSWISYFLFFEKPASTAYKTNEWFVASNTDTFSTVFPIPADESVLLENRLFHNCISAFSQKELKISIKYPTISKFRSMYNNSLKRGFFKDDSVVLNPLTGRFSHVNINTNTNTNTLPKNTRKRITRKQNKTNKKDKKNDKKKKEKKTKKTNKTKK
jgi:hypothetical protein